MNSKTQEKVIASSRMVLSKKRLAQHYAGVIVLAIISISIIFYIIFSNINSSITLKMPILILLIFPLSTIAAYINQYNTLKLKSFNTGISKSDNYSLVKKTLETLNWKIGVDNKGFVEAETSANKYILGRTWGEDMLSIIIINNAILINSIGNVDDISNWQVAFSFGKHTHNVNKFIEIFEVLSQFKGEK
jgi:hypothetical protein